MEWLISANNTNTYIMNCKFFLLGGGTKGLDTVLYEVVSGNTWEWGKVLLKICLCWLTFGTDCHSVVLVEVAWWASLEQVGTHLIDTSDEDSYTEWSLTMAAGFGLRFGCNFINQSLNWMGRLVSIPVIEWFVSHKLVEESCISGEAREDHTQVIIDVINLFLVFCQFIWGHFPCHEYL